MADKPFVGVNHSSGPIHLDPADFGALGLSEFRPIAIHHIPNGAKGDKPSFAMVLVSPNIPILVVGQISLNMLNEGLSDIGYQIVKQ